MSSAQSTVRRPAPEPAPADTASRIRFRQPVSGEGFIDAAWWPRSLDLTAELPALMNVLWTAGRPITRVTYNLDVWGHAPRRVTVEGRVVRLGGFATSDPLTVRLSDPWGRERVDVLVIAPDTDPATAERALQIAGNAGNTYRAAEILDAARDDSARNDAARDSA